MAYSMPASMHARPEYVLDPRRDEEIDEDLVKPCLPVTGGKNTWCFWQSGSKEMPDYAQRNFAPGAADSRDLAGLFELLTCWNLPLATFLSSSISRILKPSRELS